MRDAEVVETMTIELLAPVRSTESNRGQQALAKLGRVTLSVFQSVASDDFTVEEDVDTAQKVGHHRHEAWPPINHDIRSSRVAMEHHLICSFATADPSRIAHAVEIRLTP